MCVWVHKLHRTRGARSMPHCKHANNEAMANHAPSLPCWQWDSYSRPALHPACAPSCSLQCTVGPLGGLCTAKSSRTTPLPQSIHWSLSFSSLSLHTSASMRLRPGKGCDAVRTIYVGVPLPWRTAGKLELSPLQPRKLPYFSADLQPEWWNLSYFTTPTQGQFPSPFFLFFPPSSYSVMWGSFLQLWLYEICKLPVDILWELLHI